MESPALSKGARRWLHPRILLVEALVVAIFVGNELLTGRSGSTPSGSVLDLAVEALFLLPILYAALNFGVAGSFLTGGLVTLLIVAGDVGVDLADHRLHDAGTDVVMTIVLDAVAVFVGWRMAVEQSARDRYRDLFEANDAPILLLDGNGTLQEVNAAGRLLFGDRSGRSLAGIGPGAAGGPVLGQRLDALLGPSALPLLAGEVVLLAAPGGTAELRAVPGRLRSRRGQVQLQVVIENLTDEMRREQEAAAYARHVLSAQEDERRRVAQDLHDGPVQRLVSLCRALDEVEDEDELPWPLRDKLEGARSVAEVIVTELREILRGLRPPALEHLGLVPTLGRLLDEVGARSRLRTELLVEGEPCRLDGDVELTAFRVGQEALSNVERHAAATSVRLVLDFQRDALRLSVRDDGIGFVRARQPEESGSSRLGLRGMAERAQLVGGELHLWSEPCRGTEVSITVPVSGLSGSPPTRSLRRASLRSRR